MPDVTAEQLTRALSDDRMVADLYQKIMDRVLGAIVPFAQARTPVLTGATRDSETYRIDLGGRKGYLQAWTDYSPFVHARVPFFTEGIDAARAEITRILEEEGAAYFDRVVS